MENDEILNLWKSYDNKLEQALLLNKNNTEDIIRLKIRSSLMSMRTTKILTIIAGIAWVIFIDYLIIVFFHSANIFFLVSTVIQSLLTTLAIVIYLYQLILIHQTEISESIVATQERLAKLKSSTLLIARLLFLQLPVWTTFYWNKGMLENGNTLLYILQFLVTLSFLSLSLWLFRNIRYENKDKKWFRLIFSCKEWTPVLKAMELCRDIEGFKQESFEN